MKSPPVRDLPVRLTTEEKRQASERLAAVIQEIDDNKLALEGVKREHKDKDEKAQAEVRYLGRLIRTGVEERPVECEEKPNWLTSTMEIFRLDTGEKVDFRPLTREERQQQIEWDGGGEKH